MILTKSYSQNFTQFQIWFYLCYGSSSETHRALTTIIYGPFYWNKLNRIRALIDNNIHWLKWYVMYDLFPSIKVLK